MAENALAELLSRIFVLAEDYPEWIVVFAVSVLGVIDKEMSAALAEALAAITS